jgi:hypothetical protein
MTTPRFSIGRRAAVIAAALLLFACDDRSSSRFSSRAQGLEADCCPDDCYEDDSDFDSDCDSCSDCGGGGGGGGSWFTCWTTATCSPFPGRCTTGYCTAPSEAACGQYCGAKQTDECQTDANCTVGNPLPCGGECAPCEYCTGKECRPIQCPPGQACYTAPPPAPPNNWACVDVF